MLQSVGSQRVEYDLAINSNIHLWDHPSKTAPGKGNIDLKSVLKHEVWRERTRVQLLVHILNSGASLSKPRKVTFFFFLQLIFQLQNRR